MERDPRGSTPLPPHAIPCSLHGLCLFYGEWCSRLSPSPRKSTPQQAAWALSLSLPSSFLSSCAANRERGAHARGGAAVSAMGSVARTGPDPFYRLALRRRTTCTLTFETPMLLEYHGALPTHPFLGPLVPQELFPRGTLTLSLKSLPPTAPRFSSAVHVRNATTDFGNSSLNQA